MLAPVPYSPDLDVFTTPPTTPMSSESEPPRETIIRPSLSRSSSRPSNLHISKTAGDFKPDILVETQSPQNGPFFKSPVRTITPRPASIDGVDDRRAVTESHSARQADNADHTSRPRIPILTTADNIFRNRASVTSPETAPILRSHNHSQNPMSSPCFVHSNLDKGASFSEWLQTSNGLPARIDVSPVLKLMPTHSPKAPPRRYRELDNGQFISIPYEDVKDENVFDASDYDYEDDEGSASLTKQLAATAVGVREMSKQLGALLEPSSLPKMSNNGIQVARVSNRTSRMY